MSDERRVYERYETGTWSVDYASGDTFLFAYIANISEMGIFIRTERPLPVGTQLKLKLSPPEQPVLHLRGEVVWVNPIKLRDTNPNPGMGVRFAELSPEDRERVVDLVRTVAFLRQHGEH